MTFNIPNTKAWVRIDADDFSRIGMFKWKLDIKRKGKYTSYCSTHIDVGGKKYRDVPMHRMIMGLKHGDGKMVDHINGDGLDNRKSNLRVCTSRQNQMNRKVNGGVKYKGVRKPTHTKKWLARLQHEGLVRHIGYYDTAELAAKAYNRVAKEVFGDYARLNEVA